MVKVNNIFMGKLDGTTPYKKYGDIGKLDKKVKSLNERMHNVDDILNGDEFFIEYFDKHYNPMIDQDSALSDENNICQMLTSMADYLINSDESKAIDESEKTHYVFTEDSSRRREEYRQSSHNIDTDVNTSDNGNDNIAFVSMPIKPVEFKNDKISINKKDFIPNGNLAEMSKILNDYQKLVISLDKNIENDIAHKRKYTSIKAGVIDDMKMVKESYLGVFPRSKKTVHGHVIKDVKSPDYTNLKEFKAMLNSLPVALEESYEFWELSFEFDSMIEDMYNNGMLTEEQYYVIILRRNGWKYSEIIEDLYPNVENKLQKKKYIEYLFINNIAKKVAKYVIERDEEVNKNAKGNA